MNRQYTFHIYALLRRDARPKWEVVKRCNNDINSDRQLCVCRSETDADSIVIAMGLLRDDEKVHA